MPNFDFSDIVEQRIPMEPGSYRGRITATEEGESSGGKPKLIVNFACVEEGFEGKTFRANVFLTPKSLFNLFDLLRHTGLYDYSDFGDGHSINVDYEDLIGCEVGCVIVPYTTTGGDLSTSVNKFISPNACVGQTGSLSDMSKVEQVSTGLGSLAL